MVTMHYCLLTMDYFYIFANIKITALKIFRGAKLVIVPVHYTLFKISGSDGHNC